MRIALAVCLVAASPALASPPAFHKITAVKPGDVCGKVYGVGAVQYDDVTVVFPCMEVSAPSGVSFALGQVHQLELAGDVVTAIIADGKRFPIIRVTVVVAPRDAIKTLHWSFDGRLHLAAAGWARTI
jgi:hypothetical protein